MLVVDDLVRLDRVRFGFRVPLGDDLVRQAVGFDPVLSPLGLGLVVPRRPVEVGLSPVVVAGLVQDLVEGEGFLVHDAPFLVCALQAMSFAHGYLLSVKYQEV